MPVVERYDFRGGLIKAPPRGCLIKNGYHCFENDGVPVHRRIYEQEHGIIEYGYHIHHLNRVKTDNRISNLISIPASFHKWLHKMWDSLAKGQGHYVGCSCVSSSSDSLDDCLTQRKVVEKWMIIYHRSCEKRKRERKRVDKAPKIKVRKAKL